LENQVATYCQADTEYTREDEDESDVGVWRCHCCDALLSLDRSLTMESLQLALMGEILSV